jgi:hypothetical protein
MARQVQPGGWMAPPQDPMHAVHAQHAGEEESLPPQVGCTPDLLRLWSARNGGAPAAVPAWVQRIVQARGRQAHSHRLAAPGSECSS